MVSSMTGYGRAVEVTPEMTVTVELKSVNHRFFEFNSKITRGYSFLEEKLKSFFNSCISRGKIDCFVMIENEETHDGVVVVNESLLNGYYQTIGAICERYGMQMGSNVEILTSHADIFDVRKPPADEEKIWNCVQGVARKALDEFLAMRKVEGEKLKADVLQRGETILRNVEFIELRSPQTVREYYEKVQARIREIIGDAQVDEQRLLTEAAVFADKIAVAEETVRLRSHIAQLNAFLEAEEPIGRKLDFLVQEINREANTIGSKASDIEIAKKVIDIKAEVEKIREQIQNIE